MSGEIVTITDDIINRVKRKSINYDICDPALVPLLKILNSSSKIITRYSCESHVIENPPCRKFKPGYIMFMTTEENRFLIRVLFKSLVSKLIGKYSKALYIQSCSSISNFPSKNLRSLNLKCYYNDTIRWPALQVKNDEGVLIDEKKIFFKLFEEAAMEIVKLTN